MLQHLDRAVESLVRAALPPGSEVRMGPPGPAPDARSGSVSLFLHRVVEDVEARAASWTDDLDERGRVVARLPPPRRYRCCYALTAWCDDHRAENALLGAVLTATAQHVRLPVEHIPEALRSTGVPVGLDVAHPGLPTLSPRLWSALDVAPRAYLDIVLTATIAPVAAVTAAPPAQVDLGTGRGVPAPAPRAQPLPPPTRRIRE